MSLSRQDSLLRSMTTSTVAVIEAFSPGLFVKVDDDQRGGGDDDGWVEADALQGFEVWRS